MYLQKGQFKKSSNMKKLNITVKLKLAKINFIFYLKKIAKTLSKYVLNFLENSNKAKKWHYE